MSDIFKTLMPWEIDELSDSQLYNISLQVAGQITRTQSELASLESNKRTIDMKLSERFRKLINNHKPNTTE